MPTSFNSFHQAFVALDDLDIHDAQQARNFLDGCLPLLLDCVKAHQRAYGLKKIAPEDINNAITEALKAESPKRLPVALIKKLSQIVKPAVEGDIGFEFEVDAQTYLANLRNASYAHGFDQSEGESGLTAVEGDAEIRKGIEQARDIEASFHKLESCRAKIEKLIAGIDKTADTKTLEQYEQQVTFKLNTLQETLVPSYTLTLVGTEDDFPSNHKLREIYVKKRGDKLEYSLVTEHGVIESSLNIALNFELTQEKLQNLKSRIMGALVEKKHVARQSQTISELFRIANLRLERAVPTPECSKIKDALEYVTSGITRHIVKTKADLETGRKQLAFLERIDAEEQAGFVDFIKDVQLKKFPLFLREEIERILQYGYENRFILIARCLTRNLMLSDAHEVLHQYATRLSLSEKNELWSTWYYFQTHENDGLNKSDEICQAVTAKLQEDRRHYIDILNRPNQDDVAKTYKDFGLRTYYTTPSIHAIETHTQYVAYKSGQLLEKYIAPKLEAAHKNNLLTETTCRDETNLPPAEENAKQWLLCIYNTILRKDWNIRIGGEKVEIKGEKYIITRHQKMMLAAIVECASIDKDGKNINLKANQGNTSDAYPFTDLAKKIQEIGAKASANPGFVSEFFKLRSEDTQKLYDKVKEGADSFLTNNRGGLIDRDDSDAQNPSMMDVSAYISPRR